jgi:hypothetical protein
MARKYRAWPEEELLVSRLALEAARRAAEYTLKTCSDATEAGRLTRALANSRLLVINAILEEE